MAAKGELPSQCEIKKRGPWTPTPSGGSKKVKSGGTKTSFADKINFALKWSAGKMKSNKNHKGGGKTITTTLML